MKTNLTQLTDLAFHVERRAMQSTVWQPYAEALQSAIAELKDLRLALGEPVPEMKGMSALVLFFPDDASRQAFIAISKQAIPTLRDRPL